MKIDVFDVLFILFFAKNIELLNVKLIVHNVTSRL